MRRMITKLTLFMFLSWSTIATAAESAKPAWQLEWERTLAAAKKEGQVAVYISGYEEILPEFQKEYPEIKVLPTTGRGAQVGQKLLAERRAEKYLADVINAGGVTTYQQLFPAKVFDPIKPALLLPEITDTSKWYQGKHHYADPENQYIITYVATATYGSVSYNTKLVHAKDFKSYWDLLAPKWKGKIISRDIRVAGTGS
ncbi:MAG TPA: extracellular solute-binding protein, partial [Terriglobales bacterium]|nr:extracellular solute-binding protein [Terriglobales bacterium]